MDLFEKSDNASIKANAPLSARMRPISIDEILGQDDFLGPGMMLRRMLDSRCLSSVIFYGPPGCGKTTMASVIATNQDCEFYSLNAATLNILIQCHIVYVFQIHQHK